MELETATLAGGCFWCTEAIFKRLKGVKSVITGYSGGDTENPNYFSIHQTDTGHAEAIQIEFDPKELPYEKLLEIFFHLHNPTTKNRQGADVGSEYRSIIFYHSPKQKEIAEKVKERIDKSGYYQDPIVTEIVSFEKFYKGEDYEQNYYEKNKGGMYCTYVIDPKIRKLIEQYSENVKEEYKKDD